jgi:hypothetical protein
MFENLEMALRPFIEQTFAGWTPAMRQGVRDASAFIAMVRDTPPTPAVLANWGQESELRKPIVDALGQIVDAMYAEMQFQHGEAARLAHGPAAEVKGFLAKSDIERGYPALTGGQHEAVYRRLLRWRDKNEEQCRHLEDAAGRPVGWMFPGEVVRLMVSEVTKTRQ